MKLILTDYLRCIIRLVPALMLSASMVAQAQPADQRKLPKPNWDTATALQAAANPDNTAAVSGWLQQIEDGDSAELLQELQHHDRANSPAFEGQLHRLAIALAEAPLGDSADDVLLWLASYRSQVLVAHEESAAYGVPLFPVAAAAKGSQFERQRRQAQGSGEQLIAAEPKQWIQNYLAASAPEREGYLQSLRLAPADELAALADGLQSLLPAEAELAAPAGIIASTLSDPQLFLAAYQHSQGADTAAVLREAGWRLDAAQRSQMFAGVMAMPSSDKKALGISMLAPSLHSNPTVSTTLLNLLDDNELGAAAALALAGHPDPQVQASLQHMLQGGGLKARRAALALDQNAAAKNMSDEP